MTAMSSVQSASFAWKGAIRHAVHCRILATLLFGKELTQVANELGPGGFISENKVIRAVESDESGAGNVASQNPSGLERDHRIVAAMHHERGCLHFPQ